MFWARLSYAALSHTAQQKVSLSKSKDVGDLESLSCGAVITKLGDFKPVVQTTAVMKRFEVLAPVTSMSSSSSAKPIEVFNPRCSDLRQVCIQTKSRALETVDMTVDFRGLAFVASSFIPHQRHSTSICWLFQVLWYDHLDLGKHLPSPIRRDRRCCWLALPSWIPSWDSRGVERRASEAAGYQLLAVLFRWHTTRTQKNNSDGIITRLFCNLVVNISAWAGLYCSFSVCSQVFHLAPLQLQLRTPYAFSQQDSTSLFIPLRVTNYSPEYHLTFSVLCRDFALTLVPTRLTSWCFCSSWIDGIFR